MLAYHESSFTVPFQINLLMSYSKYLFMKKMTSIARWIKWGKLTIHVFLGLAVVKYFILDGFFIKSIRVLFGFTGRCLFVTQIFWNNHNLIWHVNCWPTPVCILPLKIWISVVKNSYSICNSGMKEWKKMKGFVGKFLTGTDQEMIKCHMCTVNVQNLLSKSLNHCF